MCLLKQDQKDTNCGHPECKNYYMINSGGVQMPTNMLGGGNFLIQTQNQQRSFAAAQIPFNMNLHQSMNAMRPIKIPDNANADEVETLVLNKKKLKAKDENNNKESQQSQNNTNMPNTAELGMFSQPVNAMIDNRGLINNQFFNPFLMTHPNVPKHDPSVPQFNEIVASFLQNSQVQNIYGNMGNQQNGFNLNQLMTQNMKPKVNIQQETSAVENNPKIEHGSTNEEFFQEFQTRIFGFLSSQNKMLADLKEKNEVIQDTLACLIGEINHLKGMINQPGQEKVVVANNPLVMHQIIGNSSETVTTENLITYLYGPKPDFQYHLILKTDFPLPLYRERNFKFTVLLVDQNGNLVSNSNRVPLTIGIYSSENPPKYIDSNTAGNKILKGFIEKDLVNGAATFDKIQVKEVTSHFRNGWVFFVVYPKITKTTTNNTFMNAGGVVVQNQNIKPLIIEKVIVKAKKTKERDQPNGDESPNSGYCQNDSVKEDNFYE